MKVKTAEATKKQLDWGLAKAMGHLVDVGPVGQVCVEIKGVWHVFDHTDPILCFDLIKCYRAWIEQYDDYIEVTIYYPADDSADPDINSMTGSGATLEEALADCLIALKLGDEFECPDELACKNELEV